jgi:transposase-like protein
MSPRPARPHLSATRRAEILDELRLRERLSLKAIARRHGVSRRTLFRLRLELLDGSPPRVAHSVPTKLRRRELNTPP